MNFKYYHTERLIAFALLLSLGCIYLAAKIDNWLLEWDVLSKVNHLVHAFSTLTLMIAAFALINSYGWRWKIFKWLINMPNLNGRYEGEVYSSYKVNDEFVKKKCVIEIKQTASAVHVFAYFGDLGTNLNTSESYSVSEELIKEANGFFQLYYIFTNESNVLQSQLNNHLGTARLRYQPDIKVLEGSYYNQRMNTGTIRVAFVQEEIVGRLEL